MLYLIQNCNTNYIKIGISSQPYKRLAQLQTGSGDKLKLLKVYNLDNDRVMEKRLHKMLWQSKKSGEWFNFSSPDYLQFIDDLLTKS